MVKFIQLLKNPFVPAALVLSAVFYSGLVKPSENKKFRSLIPENRISFLRAKITSNPSPCFSRKFYQFSAEPYVTGSSEKFISSADGTVKILIDRKEAEALYPGKLFSYSSGKGLLLEKGLKVRLEGKFTNENSFFMAEQISEEKADSSFSGRINRMRGNCRLIFKRLMYSWGKAGALVLSLISGSREYLEEGIEEDFKNAGLSHVLALSGMHLSFFALLSGTAGITILGKKASFYFKLSGIIFFVWFAGLSPSLYRALLCSLLSLFLGKICSSPPDFTEILCASFVIHSATKPEDLFSPAFMLSYSALLGIMIFGDAAGKKLSVFLPQKAASALGSSFGAQTASSGITARLFGSVTPAGVLSGTVISPLISFFLFLSTAATVLCLIFPSLSGLSGSVLNILYSVIVVIVRIFALVPSVHFP
ncbi:MAG: ComEC/Rec2 family competence protein [Treponema sp.]|nr:ComEC/Rec2 family competence protein [Treponema sp.]